VSPQLLGLAVFLGFSVGLGAWVILTSLKEVQEDAEEQFELYSKSPLYAAVVPFSQYFGRNFEKIRASVFLNRFREKIRKKLNEAGKAYSITADEFLGLMTVSAFLGLGVAAYFDFMIGLQWQEMAALTLLVGNLPYMNLKDNAKRRQKKIRQILPYALDLLCLAVEAGLDFTAALARIGENLKKNPLREELRLLSRDLSMGKTRPEALRDMERRVGLEELTSVVSALVQADELGASLGPTLRIQSEDLQRKRFQRAEKKAMQAPVLMLIPLVLFIFPLVFLIIFTPIALQVMNSGAIF
jgi:tight adherence protein C